MDFEWDDVKADSNFLKHGIGFSEAATIWRDDLAAEISDPEHSLGEDRWIRIGISKSLQVIVVVYVEKIENERVRIISARKATRAETADYQWR